MNTEIDNAPMVALEFLKAMYPFGPWLCTSIDPDGQGKGIHNLRVSPEDTDSILRWLQEHHNRKWNTYFSSNQPADGFSGKATKKAIKAVHYFHVDIDPSKDKPLAEEQARILELVNDMPAGLLPPTAVVFSGGGYQLYWKLKEPILIHGDEKTADDVALYNRQLSELLGGDKACVDISHIMRLPGTVNFPNKLKRTAGRVPVLAKLVWFKPELVYTLDRFAKAELSASGHANPSTAVDIGAPVKTIDPKDLDQFAVDAKTSRLIERCQVMMVQARDPDKPKEKDDSRSAWVFDFMCNMIRAKVPDEHTLGILLDPDYAISESILERRGTAEKNARRQIGNAHDFVKLDQADFDKSEKGATKATIENMRLALFKFGVTLHYNDFSGEPVIDGLPGHRLLDDHAVNMLIFAIYDRFGFYPPEKIFRPLLVNIALRNRVHPVREYLEGTKWDGVPRIGNWLHRYSKAKDDAYTNAVGLHWLTAAVRRVLQPGVKFDEILVLESDQGMNKSSALKILAVKDEWFTDNVVLGSDSKKVIEGTQGHWIIEAAELHGMSATKAEQLKSFLSRSADKARLSYDRLPKTVLRQSVFAGTTNGDSYLTDTTGNRRVWPVKVGRFDLEALRRDRDQLWAEAVEREATGVSIHLEEELWQAARVQQEARVDRHPFVDVLETALGDREGKFLCTDAWVIMSMDPRMTPNPDKVQTAIGNSMRVLGWKRALRRINGAQKYCYAKGNEKKFFRAARNRDGALELTSVDLREAKYVQEQADL